MSNEFKIYLLTRLDNILSFSQVISGFSCFVILFYFLIKFIDFGDEEDGKHYEKRFGYFKKIAFYFIIIFGIIATFLPSKNEAIMIYAGGKTMDFMQKDSSLNKIPAKTTELIFKYIDDKSKELDSKK